MTTNILPQNNHAATAADSEPAARVFVAVKAAPDIADELTQMAVGLARFGVHHIAPADIHLTLVPPWNETSISAAIAKLRGVTDKAQPFS